MRREEQSQRCNQCGFEFSRIDSESWTGGFSSRRVMCPACGWSLYEEFQWIDSGAYLLAKRNERHGFGAFRIVPPFGYSGYNAFHTKPTADEIAELVRLLELPGWTGYISVWDEESHKARLTYGTPLRDF